jgi:tetratricopeptide (TPR) repeat protein
MMLNELFRMRVGSAAQGSPDRPARDPAPILTALLLTALLGALMGGSVSATPAPGQTDRHLGQVQNPLAAADAADDLARLKALEHRIEEGKYEDVVPPLQAYLKDYPKSSRGHYDLGYVLFRIHRIGESIRELSDSLKLDLKNAEAHKILALDCNILGRYDLAEPELETAVRLKPESAEIHYLLGRLYYTKGVYPLARREFEAAIRLDPTYMKAHNNLGLTMEVLGNNEAALKYYSKAAQLDEEQKLNSEWPFVYLSAFYNRQEKSDLALQYARKAASINPKSDLAYFQMAKAYRVLGEWEQCADAARKAVAINSKTPDFFYVLSLALRKLGKSEESQQAMRIFRRLQDEDRELAEKRLQNQRSHPDSMAIRDNE